jgi:hypothetical protein
MEAAATNTKLDKATTPAAIAAAEKLRNFVSEYIEKAQKML